MMTTILIDIVTATTTTIISTMAMIIQNNERTAATTCEKYFHFIYGCQEKTQHPIKHVLPAMNDCLDVLTLSLF